MTVSTVIFRTTVIALCDLAVVAVGAWVLWNSSATSVVSGPVEDKLLVVLAIALMLTMRHTVSRSTDSLLVTARTARAVLWVDLLLAASGVVAWQISGIYYMGWLTTFALMFFILGAGLELLVDVVTSRYRASASDRRPSFATEFTRLIVMLGAAVGFTVMSPMHAWDVGFINPLVLMMCVAIGLSVVPAALAFTGVLTRSSLARDLNFAVTERHERETISEVIPVTSPGTVSDTAPSKKSKGKVRPGPVRTGMVSAEIARLEVARMEAPTPERATISAPERRERARNRTSGASTQVPSVSSGASLGPAPSGKA